MPKSEREPWVQTNTEFHQDWTADENQGDSIKWKKGLSLETTAEDRKRRYAVTGARARRLPWFFWPILLGLLVGLAIILVDATGTADVAALFKSITR